MIVAMAGRGGAVDCDCGYGGPGRGGAVDCDCGYGGPGRGGARR